MRRIHHVGIVVNRLSEAYQFYRDVLGLPLVREAEIADQGVRAALLAAGDSEVELLEPLGPTTPVGRFLAKRGEGLHHLCFETSDVGRLVDDAEGPRRGAARHGAPPGAGRPDRVSPSARVLRRAGGGGHPAEPSARAGLTATGSSGWSSAPRTSGATAGIFQSLFGFSEVAINGGPRTMLAVGRGTLLVVPAHEVGGTAGMVALSFVAEDFAALTASLRRAGTPRLEGTGEVTVEPAGSHGVHLHISRYMFP